MPGEDDHPSAPEYITADEIARRMGVSRSTVYDHVLRDPSPGALPYHQLGRVKKVSRAVFERWWNGEVSGSGRDELRDLRQAR